MDEKAKNCLECKRPIPEQKLRYPGVRYCSRECKEKARKQREGRRRPTGLMGLSPDQIAELNTLAVMQHGILHGFEATRLRRGIVLLYRKFCTGARFDVGVVSVHLDANGRPRFPQRRMRVLKCITDVIVGVFWSGRPGTCLIPDFIWTGNESCEELLATLEPCSSDRCPFLGKKTATTA